MTRTDHDTLVAGLRGLQPTVPAPGIVEQLERTVGVVDVLLGHSGAGLMFSGEQGELRYLVTTDEAGHSLEGAQLHTGRGPCISSFAGGTAVTSCDVRNDPRWPELAERLHPDVRAVAGVPVRLGGRPVGTLNVYRSAPTTGTAPTWSPSTPTPASSSRYSPP
nr:hypothetical protein GCM10020093_067950 [Planobispora longispora]